MAGLRWLFQNGRGFPKFARRGAYRSFAFKQGVKLHPNTNTVLLPKVGKIKYRNSRLLPADATIKRACVNQQADGWYLSLCVETDVAPLPMATNAIVGIDVGITALATLSTGEIIANPRHLQQAQHRLTRLQQAVSRKKKGGQNRRKAINKLARQHLKVRYCRQDCLHKLTTRLIRENQAVITERLNIAGMLQESFPRQVNRGCFLGRNEPATSLQGLMVWSQLRAGSAPAYQPGLLGMRLPQQGADARHARVDLSRLWDYT